MATLPKFSFGLSKKDDDQNNGGTQSQQQDDSGAQAAADPSAQTGDINFAEIPATDQTSTTTPIVNDPFASNASTGNDVGAAPPVFETVPSNDAPVQNTNDPFASNTAVATDPFANNDTVAMSAPTTDPFANSTPALEVGTPVTQESAPQNTASNDPFTANPAVPATTSNDAPPQPVSDPFASPEANPTLEVPQAAEAAAPSTTDVNPFGDFSTPAESTPVEPTQETVAPAVDSPFGNMVDAPTQEATPEVESLEATITTPDNTSGIFANPVAEATPQTETLVSANDHADPTQSLGQIKTEIEGFVAYHTNQIKDYRAQIKVLEKKISEEKTLLKSKKAEFRDMLHEIETLTEVTNFNDESGSDNKKNNQTKKKKKIESEQAQNDNRKKEEKVIQGATKKEKTVEKKTNNVPPKAPVEEAAA